MHKIIILGILAVAAYFIFAKPAQATTGGVRPSFAPGVDTPKVTPGVTTIGNYNGFNLSNIGVKKYN